MRDAHGILRYIAVRYGGVCHFVDVTRDATTTKIKYPNSAARCRLERAVATTLSDGRHATRACILTSVTCCKFETERPGAGMSRRRFTRVVSFRVRCRRKSRDPLIVDKERLMEHRVNGIIYSSLHRETFGTES